MNKPFKFRKPTIFIALFIIVSASFMRQVMNFSKKFIGNDGAMIFISGVLLLSGFLFCIYIFKKKIGFKRLLVSLVILIAGLILSWKVKFPSEKIHVFEYALLGWLAMIDLRGVGGKIKKVLGVFLFILLIGSLDEGFQAVLPYRIFEVRDIVINVLGGVWGMVLYKASNKDR